MKKVTMLLPDEIFEWCRDIMPGGDAGANAAAVLSGVLVAIMQEEAEPVGPDTMMNFLNREVPGNGIVS